MAGRFLYGAATSAHQVEGNNVNNDWWAWEQKRPREYRSGLACDHFRLYRDDFRLARELGHNAHRLSFEWSRIEPKRGKFDYQALEHYRQVLTALRQEGMKSFVTLWHFTNPVWLSQQGGWSKPASVEYWQRYVDKTSEYLGDLIDFWLTVNEPVVYAEHSWWRGNWPPQHHSLWSMLKVEKNLARAHRAAFALIKKRWPDATVGAANNLIAYIPFEPRRFSHRWAAMAGSWWFNQRWLKATAGTHDFIGVNYYFQNRVKAVGALLWPEAVPWEGEKTDLGWPIRPEGLEQVLGETWRRYRLPIYITENGLADANDSRRANYIRRHLRAIENAQRAGADIRGYLHWSLLDNFEWAEGFKPRFGLVEIDYRTQARIPRPSAYVYRAIIEASQ